MAKSLRSSLAIFRVVDMDQAPLPGLFAVNLGFYTVSGNCGSVFAHRRTKNPVKFGPRRIAVHMDRHALGFKIACREHAAHDILKNVLLDSIESALFAQRIVDILPFLKDPKGRGFLP